MTWSVEWSRPHEAEDHRTAIPNQYMAIRGKVEAMEFAEKVARDGDTLWRINDERGQLFMTGEVFLQQRGAKTRLP